MNRLARLILLCGLTGCTGALFTEIEYREGHVPPAPETRLETKADVLDVLGAPQSYLAQRNGDVFVYRLSDVDIEVLNLNTGIFTGVFVPIYARLDGEQLDRLVFVFFDTDGRVTNMAVGGRYPRA
jgi:hypothetical protein